MLDEAITALTDDGIDDNLSTARSHVARMLDEAITALTDDGIDELTDMLRDARLTAETWHQFLDDFVSDPELVQRFKAQPPR
ncbi:hypothetical protein DPM13_15870 [Paracoccus mutanolyticus]|uniref:Uncharacterized protein n=1 Tax=Paracoccus mutanolyticus TaxID=1499308 RepID=A0ABN5M7H1_9RHOB|nr:hypothetical protein [Paracoccus mutanolyticus]AWX93949.1 hypothetical protein DPM13_15870 [Paracoccus mutanolyticus]